MLFMVLSAAIMVAYVAIQATFFPKPAPAPVAKKELDKAKPADAKTKDKPATAPDGGKPETPATGESPANDNANDKSDDSSTRATPTWITLGSVDPQSPYRMLVTLSSKGGAIERIEMASPRYLDLEDPSGYLGHLALTNIIGTKGVLVNAVGAGTPAALAVQQNETKASGLAVGDVIESIDGQAVLRVSDFNDFIAKTKPEQSIKIGVKRGDQKLAFTTVLTRRPLQVIRPEVEVAGEHATEKVHPLSGLLTLAGQRNVDATSGSLADDPLRTNHWEAKQTTHKNVPAVEFTYRLSTAQAEKLALSGPVEVVRRYWLATVTEETSKNASEAAYHLNTEFEVRNLSDETLQAAYVLDGPNGLPTEGWWYSTKIGPSWTAAGARDVVWRRNAFPRSLRECSTIYKYAKANEEKPAESLLPAAGTTPLDYIGVDAQYFSAVWLTNPKDNSFRSAVTMPAFGVDSIEKVDMKRTNVTFRMTSDLKAIPANGSYKQEMRLFAGPKVPSLLAAYGMDDVIEYGWFRMVSIPLAHLLHFLENNLLFNYGLAIVALTVIVRGCMVPFSLKAAKSAKLMQELQPEMKAIKEKYKNDPQKAMEAQSALFKKYNYNPLSGCLPMFLQLPIFLGLYRALATDIELRQAALIPGLSWASNLAGPDKLWYWKDYLPNFLAGEAAGWLGPYFNILPIVSVCFLLVHQKLFTPPATDEQTKMTQDMMKYMTVFMGVMFFKVPAGLCIYFITSSLWSVCERLWLPKSATAPVATTEAKAEVKTTTTKTATNGADDRRKRLKQKKR